MLHTLADKNFFEDIANIEYNSKFQDVLLENLPAEWTTSISGVWLAAHPPERKLRPHGFKIHLSAKATHAEDVIRAGSRICFEQGISFKIARDPLMLSVMNSKHYPRGNAGKLMTIYPQDEEQFLIIAPLLHDATQNFEGPYILSDKRYTQTGVVYYRYGEIVSHTKLTISGTRQSELYAPDGSTYKEDRLPYYKLPPWVTEPFPDSHDGSSSEGSGLVGGRYKVIKALTFSNGGGIYLATDTICNDRKVVLKEARPHAAQFRLDTGDLDASMLLRHEFDVLSRLISINGVIDVYDIIQDWEHTFLVEQYFEGVPFTRFRARSDINLLPFERDEEKAKNFCTKISKIALQAIEILDEIHRHDVVVGDLSPGNLLIDPNTLEITLIDFEGASVVGGTIPKTFTSMWATSGFRDKSKAEHQDVSQKDDWYALGMIVFSAILPIQSLFDFDASNVEQFLEELSSSAGLPEEMGLAIHALWKAEPVMASAHFQRMLTSSQSPIEHRKEPTANRDIAPLIAEVLDGIDKFLGVTCQPERTDRLWPSDPESFNTNPLSVAYGCGGPMQYLSLRMGLTSTQETWYLNAIERSNELPPGLYNGSAGIAVILHQAGYIAEGKRLLKQALTSPLIGEESNLFQGDAGVVLSTLLCDAFSQNPEAISVATKIARQLIFRESKSNSTNNKSWEISAHGKHHLGYAFGGSGVALSLLYLGTFLNDEQIIFAAKNAIDAEIDLAISDGKHISWGATPAASVSEPYWLHGASGVGSALIRFGCMLDDPRYTDLARQAADSCFSAFTVHPGQFEGMSGIGEFMLDMHQLTGDALYLERARILAKNVSLYRVQGQRSLGFLGRGLQRLSCDYAYGASGVGSFMHRLQNGNSRFMHDLPMINQSRKA
ncbi:class III lanthionine synthetase LanKC [Solilutibacter silvestris]|uniref:Lanthionine synthetase C-like protein n=1 Tax=Solilutibacter silvestris TaxID=1645665 RepID=A0A2K1Q1E4_9GAMM|nr:class III lanthionine synthetase LanKC [Lysobacter silvestris]PNS08856.1 Lanthionine synthetase C-like protein [Lysobacter silvestris]